MYYSHILIVNPTNVTKEIYKYACSVLEKGWKKEPIRLIGIRLDNLTMDNNKQLSLFDDKKDEGNDKIQEVLDNISNKYGDNIIIPASLKEKDK